MKKVIVALCVLVMAGSLAYGEVFKLDNLALNKARGIKTSDKSSGKALWTSRTTSKKIVDKGQTFLYITDDGAGIFGKDKTYKTWHSDAYYKLAGNLAIPYDGKLVYKDKDGTVVMTIKKDYYPADTKAVVTINSQPKEFVMRSDLIDKELVGTALANYPFDNPRDFVFYMLTNEPTVYKMTLKYRGVEKINGVDSYKLEMIPDLGALGIFGAFVPKTYFWYTTSAPHEFVRYEGLESGLGTPYIVMESVL